MRSWLPLWISCALGCGASAEAPLSPDASLLDAEVSLGSDAQTRDADPDDAGWTTDVEFIPDATLTDAALTDAEPQKKPDAGPPVPPTNLVYYQIGDPADQAVNGQGGLILMGGGPEVDEAFLWWRPRIGGGDVVVLRTSGADGYQDYLYSDIGGADSVTTLLVTSRALADDPWVAQQVEDAEGVFMAGGDQSTYLNFWKDTALETALQNASRRGAVVGGTSAGLAVLGEYIFAAYQGSITSAEALTDPYDSTLTLERGFLDFPPLTGIITDSHFGERDRFGRLVAFLARLWADGWQNGPIGVGVDEQTAVVITAEGQGRVLGEGRVYWIQPDFAAQVCSPGQPLSWQDVSYLILEAGDTIEFPGGASVVRPDTVSVTQGALDNDPY